MSETRLVALDICRMSEEEVWQLLDRFQPTELVSYLFAGGKQKLGKMEVDAPDVVVKSNIRYTIVSWYLWQLHRWYPNTPLLAEHHLSMYQYTSKVIPDILTKIVKSIITAYGDQVDFDLLAQQLYTVSNSVYNMTVKRLGAYVETVSAMDYIQVLYHPEIVALREKFMQDPNTKSINELYDTIPRVVAKPDFLPPGNALVSTMNIKETSIEQINQCIGARGKTTDLNSYMFKNTITDCYATGLSNIADFIQESRSATKSLLFQRDPIRDTEYFNRRLQLIAQPIRFLIKGDCGTKDTLDWNLQPGELKHLSGRNYVKDGKIFTVLDEREHKYLVGTTVKLRSPTMCLYKQHGGICETCYGSIARTLPKGTNIGHLVAYRLGERITQKVLSVKHLDYSTEIKDITLDQQDLKYVKLGEKRSELIYFNPLIKKVSDPTLLLSVDEVGNLTQAMMVSNLNELSIYKISAITRVGIRYTVDDEIEVTDWVTVSGPSRPSSLTVPFLEYIQKVQYSQQDSKYIEVRLNDWDITKPAFQLPQKQINMLDFMKHLSDMIECSPRTSAKKGLDPSNPEDVVAYIRSLYDYSSQYTPSPLLYFEIMATAVMATDPDNRDYRIPLDNHKREFVSAPSAMYYRSVGPALAYEEQSVVIYNSISYNKQHKVDHPMNALFLQNPESNLYKLWDYNNQRVNTKYSEFNRFSHV